MFHVNKWLLWATFWTVELIMTIFCLIGGEAPTPYDAVFPLAVSACNYWYFFFKHREKKTEDLEDLWEDE